MGKKKRKSHKSAAARRRSATRSGAPRTTRPSRASRASAPPKEVDFGAEYGYVLGDLKRIAILAAVMFASLVVLALVLR